MDRILRGVLFLDLVRVSVGLSQMAVVMDVWKIRLDPIRISEG